ncbi:hypothetical protein HIC20_01865 [Buchnera aphidicola (Hormaphis cornu)]|nr:hypothetical protein HIC20_01865 [Buchnera aphidicola (Hormaphis cornu)]
MFITNNQLFYDTINFFYHKIKLICVISIFSALITSNIDYLIIPDIKNIYILCVNKISTAHSLIHIIEDMTQEQQNVLFKYSLIRSITSLIGNTILTFSIIILVNMASSRTFFNYITMFKNLIFMLPNLFLLMLIITIITQFCFMILVIPGILLCILFSLSPIILIRERTNVLTSLKKSCKITYSQIKILSPAIIAWLFLKFLLLIFDAILNILPGNFFIVILSTIINLITSFLIVYLYRFYMIFSSS